MKRFVPILLVLFLFTACEKEPNTDDLDDNFLVYTDYDKTEDFGSFTKFYIPDSILLISDSKEAQYWKDDNALRIIEACVDNMEERGYQRVDKKDQADLGIQMSYVEDTQLISLEVNETTTNTKKLSVIWDAYMTGLLSSSHRINTELAITAVNQAFIQSPYLKK